jgi:hypothetical protein
MNLMKLIARKLFGTAVHLIHMEAENPELFSPVSFVVTANMGGVRSDAFEA